VDISAFLVAERMLMSRLLRRLYFTQAGFRITPVVGLIQNTAKFNANTEEVSEIHQISFADMLNSSRYALTRYSEARGHYSFSQGQLRIAGPTVSVMIGFFETLLAYCNNKTVGKDLID
jgi:hypothetical protein